jgi:aminoglycoside phosphotransferase (APT) family kinase protein
VLEAWLRRRLTNASRPLGWSYGDFGYGNLLADQASGRLQAVVDWETGRADEMLGVDWMNMLAAREGWAAI